MNGCVFRVLIKLILSSCYHPLHSTGIPFLALFVGDMYCGVGLMGRERACVHLAGEGGSIRLGVPSGTFLLCEMHGLIFGMFGYFVTGSQSDSVENISSIHDCYSLLLVVKWLNNATAAPSIMVNS
ncbi:hypothetical protein CXU19_00310 [Akkermansia muciniphila]|nr:hypothetical protein CXU19_00310 [Akkermansia muciniphila]PNC37559.1 hypothetical protein CXU20_12255 [Akkermansia muciniphila]